MVYLRHKYNTHVLLSVVNSQHKMQKVSVHVWAKAVYNKKFQTIYIPVADLRGGTRDARPPPGPKFLHFHAVFGKNWPNNRLAPPPFGVSAPSSGKSWIRHCILISTDSQVQKGNFALNSCGSRTSQYFHKTSRNIIQTFPCQSYIFLGRD